MSQLDIMDYDDSEEEEVEEESITLKDLDFEESTVEESAMEESAMEEDDEEEDISPIPSYFHMADPDLDRKEQNMELMLLRKQTRNDKTFSYVPKPREPLPTNPLPRWRLLKLDDKLPSIPGPKGTFVNTRNQVSKPVTFSY